MHKLKKIKRIIRKTFRRYMWRYFMWLFSNRIRHYAEIDAIIDGDSAFVSRNPATDMAHRMADEMLRNGDIVTQSEYDEFLLGTKIRASVYVIKQS